MASHRARAAWLWTSTNPKPFEKALADKYGAKVNIEKSASRLASRHQSLKRLQSLVQISNQIIDLFNANRQAHNIGTSAGSRLLLFVQLAMRC